MLSFFTHCLNVFSIVIILEQMFPITNNQATPYICFFFLPDRSVRDDSSVCICMYVACVLYPRLLLGQVSEIRFVHLILHLHQEKHSKIIGSDRIV